MKCTFKSIGKGKIIAEAVVEHEGLFMKCTIIDGNDGPFVSLPRQKASEKWYAQAWWQPEIRERMNGEILDQYFASQDAIPF
jgi:DNA-binding cell septation regulator SpoVG